MCSHNPFQLSRKQAKEGARTWGDRQADPSLNSVYTECFFSQFKFSQSLRLRNGNNNSTSRSYHEDANKTMQIKHSSQCLAHSAALPLSFCFQVCKPGADRCAEKLGVPHSPKCVLEDASPKKRPMKNSHQALQKGACLRLFRKSTVCFRTLRILRRPP